MILLPTVILNSAWWGQADSIYTAFILISIVYLLKKRYFLSFVFLGISFSFKLQFIFILPLYILVYLSTKEFSIWNFFIIPIMNINMCLPAILCGKSAKSCLSVYINQTKEYSQYISMNFPGLWSIFGTNSENSINLLHLKDNSYGNIGIIIIDEEHDDSYKSETIPKYNAKEVADYIAVHNNIPLVMGSATPDIKTYYEALNGSIKLLTLKERVSKSGLPNIEIVDMRDELATGNKTVFSRKLYFAMKDAIKNKEQIMLFLNRRGYSTFVMCRDCGYVVKCEDCDVSMTYHMDENRLICHYCGRAKEVMNVCPSCGKKNIRYFGSGTQKIEMEIKKYFPEASVIRMDVDTTRVKNGHEKILNKFRDEKIDILLGTQMITKGHDFSNVTLVGVLAADSSINIGDYRANEKTYELLTQMSGRAGRGDKKGTAIIQTYMPDEFSIESAKEQNYTKFYNTEINIREKLNYPPFCDIIVSVISGKDENIVKAEVTRLYGLLKVNFNAYNPVPAPISKINGEYRWRILIKEKVTDERVSEFYDVISNFRKDQSNDVKVSVDINPNNML